MNLLSDGFYISLIQWWIGSVLYVCVLIWMQRIWCGPYQEDFHCPVH